MSKDKICRTVRQYSREPIAAETMDKLVEIGEDYRTVKNYVYHRFGGIHSLEKLFPGYTVQNEMTASGLRETLGLPSVYFYLAVFEALGDIKTQWTLIKSQIEDAIGRKENFSPDDKHYLRYILKVNRCFEAVLLGKTPQLDETMLPHYQALCEKTDKNRLHNYLRRQVRKKLSPISTNQALSFAVSERAYRYGDGGIYISTKEKRKRLFIPLTDGNSYKTQIRVQLYPEENRLEIQVPVYVKVKLHADYRQRIGLSFGFHTMLTTSDGMAYGEEFGRYCIEKADWEREQARLYSLNRQANPGRKKYEAEKKQKDAALHGYINQELNRFFKTERPKVIYFPKLPKNIPVTQSKQWNNKFTQWQKGYVRRRLLDKCSEHSVNAVEVFGKGISTECSACGASGIRNEGQFVCPDCGLRLDERVNAARNALKRGDGNNETIQE